MRSAPSARRRLCTYTWSDCAAEAGGGSPRIAPTGGAAVVVEVFLPAGPWRTLGDSPEQERRFEVVRGELTFKVDDATYVVGAGERLTVPAGSEYRLRSTGSRPAQFVCEIRPALDF